MEFNIVIQRKDMGEEGSSNLGYWLSEHEYKNQDRIEIETLSSTSSNSQQNTYDKVMNDCIMLQSTDTE